MGQALYRKYRSRSLEEIVGQEHITKTLANSLKAAKISHAYLLTGPRGVGKTSVARILAHAINNLPYNSDSLPIDIIEIDAASNRRIDEIRELRDKVHIAPVSAKYKVYIIDEVHMLTKEAFNALLKTLEEPPAHVVFILATTEAHKLPETIISRTQRFTFKPIDTATAVEHLRTIAKQEKLKVDDAALELIATHGEGSFRDSISLLDQASTITDQVTVEDVRQLLGIPSQAAITGLLETVTTGTPEQLLEQLGDLQVQGYHPAAIAKQLSMRLRQLYLEGQTSFSPEQALRLMERLLTVPSAEDSESLLEIILLDVNLQSIPSRPAPETPTPAVATAPPAKAAESAPPTPRQAPSNNQQGQWQQVLQIIKQRHNTLYSVLRMSQPVFQKDKLVLQFGFVFHQKRLQEAKNHQLVSDVVKQVMGKPITIESTLVKGVSPIMTDVSPPPPSSVDTLNNIFGDIEVLES